MNQEIYPDLSNITKNELNHSHILLTGGTGFFGKNLLEFFHNHINRQNSNLKVSVLARNPYSTLKNCPHLLSQKNFDFLRNDIINLNIPNISYTHVIHGATSASAKMNAENPLQMANTIVYGTRNILEYTKKNSIPKFLFLSSGGIYGKQPSDITHMDEGYLGSLDCYQPAFCYHEAKRMAEMYTSIYGKMFQIDTKIVRCFAFTGPFLDFHAHFAIGNFIRDAFTQENIVVQGDGTPLRSYLYSTDLVVWLIELLYRGDKKPYNIGSDEIVSIKELAYLVSDIVANIRGKKARISILKEPKSNAPIEQYIPNIQRIKTDLNLKVSIPLQQAIYKTALWFQQNKLG